MTLADKHRPAFIDQPESRRLEFKEVFPKGDQVAQTAVAFANGAGGKIVFGVKDSPRKIIGIHDDQLFKTEERINNCIFDRCTPSIIPEIYIQTVEGKSLLVVEIFPGAQKPYGIKKPGKPNEVYIRVGASNRKASQETIITLERQRMKVSFDALPVLECDVEDVNLSNFKKTYKSQTGRQSGKPQLLNLGLVTIEQGQQFPTNAALLLSDAMVRKRYFPYAKIECARFKGTDKRVFLDQTTIDLPIHEAVEPCLAFIKKNIALGSTIGEIYREDRWEYPLEAIREALINAVIHRDYAILGSDIKVAVYDDMLEITSPGLLPDSLPVEELGTGRSEIRNRVLAPIFKDLKLVEAWGSGISKIRNELNEYPEIELILKEVGQAFQVQFAKIALKEAESGLRAESGAESGVESRAESQPKSMKPRILQTLSSGPLSKSEIAEKLGMEKVTGHLNRIVRELLLAGRIEYTVPEKPNSRLQKYRLTNDSN